MFAPSKIKVGSRAVALAFALATSSFSAHAVLERTGPVSIAPSIGGYPSWYQDTTGIALEFCAPNAAEVAGGWCLLLPGDVVAPEVFPANFFDEHFYFAASAIMTHQGGGHSSLILAEEAAFAAGGAVPGDQITFARIRVRLAPIPVSGTYRFIHPYGEQLIEGIAGDKIFFSDDVGVSKGNFDGSLLSRLGPFLLPSAVPGGAEMPALTATNPTPDINPANFGGVFTPTAYPNTGKAYIADPARIGPVTGSNLPNFIDSNGVSRNHNIFRIEGPPGSGLGVDPATGAIVDWVETTDFSLMGRVFNGVMPSRLTVDRASYTRNATAQKLDVFATALPTGHGRLPGAARPAVVAPTVTFFDAACAGTVDALGTIRPPFSAPLGAVETPMRGAGNMQWAQTQPVVIPSVVCVKDASARDLAGNLVPLYAMHTVTDEVAVTPAFYDPLVGTLTVGASSSDTVLAPTLSLAYGTFMGDLAGGQIVVPGMIAPPANAFVQSSALGSATHLVSTGFAAGAPTGIPVAANDAFTFPMNSAAQVLAVLANDNNATGATVTLTSAPTRGTAVVNAGGTVTYTPNLNATGADAFTYTMTVGALTSNTAISNITITPVNIAPVAVNDTATAVVNIPTAINVLANDTDANGAADIVAVVNVTAPVGPSTLATAVAAGGAVTFTAPVTGTYTFTYQAMDAGAGVSAGLASNTATVTVQVAAAESFTAFSPSEYIRNKSRLRVGGNIAPVANQTVRVDFVNAAGTVLGTAGTVTSGALGAWLLDKVIALPVGTVSVKATGANGGVRAQALTLK